MRKVFKLGATALILATGLNLAHAGYLYCSGTVEKLAYHSGSGNGLMIKLNTMNVPVFICHPDVEWTVPGTPYTTPPAACKALYATMLAARLNGGIVNSMMFEGDGVPASCTGWANWTRANVRYVDY